MFSIVKITKYEKNTLEFKMFQMRRSQYHISIFKSTMEKITKYRHYRHYSKKNHRKSMQSIPRYFSFRRRSFNSKEFLSTKTTNRRQYSSLHSKLYITTATAGRNQNTGS